MVSVYSGNWILWAILRQLMAPLSGLEIETVIWLLFPGQALELYCILLLKRRQDLQQFGPTRPRKRVQISAPEIQSDD